MSLAEKLVEAVASVDLHIAATEDWEALVSIWRDVQDARKDLGELNAELEAKIYNLQSDKERISGDQVIVRYRPASHKWDDQEVRRRIRLFATDKVTGEVDESHAAEIERRSAKISYWRVGDLPFEVDEDVRSATFGAKKIRLEPKGVH